MDQQRLPWFRELNRGLTDRLDEPRSSSASVTTRRCCTLLAGEMLVRVQAINPVALDDLPMLAGLDKNAASNLLREAA
jgi:hypothetical protein